jgi:thiol-disulfide isomerase/thioredoxin
VNKKLLIVVGVVVAMLVAGAAYVVGNRMAKTDVPSVATANPAASEEQPVAEDAPATPQPGTYTDYSAEKHDTTKGTKILFFYAQWCPQCRALEADIQNGPVPENVTIFKVPYDTAQDLRQKYGVTLQTTLVKVDDNGSLVKKYVAYDEPTLAALIKNLL